MMIIVVYAYYHLYCIKYIVHRQILIILYIKFVINLNIYYSLQNGNNMHYYLFLLYHLLFFNRFYIIIELNYKIMLFFKHQQTNSVMINS